MRKAKPILGKLATILIIALLVQSCALFTKVDETEGWSAQKLYTEGKEKVREGDYETAIRYFETLQGRYPFGRFAQQAQLELAYAYYRYDEPDAAIATLDRFIRTYPRNPFVDYAYYLKGLVNFNRAASLLDRFVPRDPTRTDTTTARQSFDDFSELVRRFPESKYSVDAQQRMLFLRNNLAVYEINVADYYMRRGAYIAAANRGKYVLENFSLSPSTEDALAIMAYAYIEMDLFQLAEDAARVLRLNYPYSEHLAEIDIRMADAEAENT